MTMRLDIVTNESGELVRREHARELGAGVVIAIYRLAKLAMMHDLGNQAFIRQLEQTHQMIGEYCLRSGSNLSALFADKATFVAGQLLKASRATYEMAAELGSLLEKLGGSELHISRDITREEVNQLAEQISLFHRTGNATQVRFPAKIRLRHVADSARLRGLELENLTSDQRIMRAYASAVVIMRRFFEDLQSSRYVLPRRIKRISQSLVDLSDASTAAFLGVTEVRNANFDEAGRAVNTAILAVSIARESTHDRIALAQIAMAAIMHDVARPRALALAGAGGSPMPGMAGPTTLSEDQEDRLAAGAAAVLTALGRVNEPSITRTVLTFEALWLRRKTWLGPVYWGARPPTLHATIIAVARRYNDLLTPEPGLQPPTTDFAIATLANELTDAQDRTVLRMLVSALGLLPTGTVVQLSTGEVAEVTRGARGLGDRPAVKVVADANGTPFPQPIDLDLKEDRRTVLRVLSVDGWRKGLEGHEAPPGPGFDPDDDAQDVAVSVPPPPMVPSAPAPAPISPLSPVVSAQQQDRGGAGGRSSADRYADQYASWGAGGGSPQSQVEELVEEEPAARTDSSSSSLSGEHPASASMPSLGSSPSAVAEAMGRMINDSLRPPAIAPREADRPDRTVFQPNSPEDAPAPRVFSSSAPREPTARGNLAATPLPHVLVYMLDHALTGGVVFEGTNANGTDDTVYFVNGVPAKIRLGDIVALLGDVLVEDGSLEARAVDQAVEGARRLGILIGEYLVGHDLVTREALAWGLEGQLLRKIAHVANLAPEIQYAYYRDVDLLEGWGGEVIVSHPLNPILASVRHWTDRARVRATLNRIGKHPLALHPDSDLTNIAVISEEQTVLDAIRGEAMTLTQLFKQKLADDEVVSSLVYSLAVTRQFAFKGQKKGPMAARGAAWRAAGGGNPASSAPGLPNLDASSERRAVSSSGAQATAAAASSASRPAIAIPMTAKAAVAASGGGAAAPPPAMQPAALAPPPPEPRVLAPPPSRIGPSSSQMRTAAPIPAAAPPPPGARAMAPAARPNSPAVGAGGAGAPQIRQVVKKASVDGAPPPAARPPPPSVRDLGAAPPTGGGGAASGRPSSPDDAKTLAVSSPSLKDIIAKRPIAPPPPPNSTARATGVGLTPPNRANTPAAKPNLPPSARGIPTGANPKAGGPPNLGGGAGAGGAKPSPTSMGKLAPAKAAAEDFSDETGRVNSNSIEIGDAGIADAEAALEAMTSFRLAEGALQRNDLAGAEQHAKKALAGDPTMPDYISLYAWIRSLRGPPQAMDEAIRTMSKVLIEDPSNERALFYRGKLLVRMNRFPEALHDFEELLSSNPSHREAQKEVRELKSKVPS